MKKKYKLKTEIREAIIRKVQESPELGCRKISAFILEQFNLPVSKSSISTVLKSAGLNKPVGRPVYVQRTGRPVVRKKDTESSLDLVEHLDSAQRGLKCGELLEPQTVQEAALIQKPAQNIQAVTPAQKAQIIILPEPQLEPIPTISHATEFEPEISFPNMGCWFLKAADLCLGGLEAISDILNPIISGEESHKSLQPFGFQDEPSADNRKKDSPRVHLIALNETMFYLPLFGIEDAQDLDALANNALAIISGKKFSKNDIQTHLIHCEAIKRVSLQIFNQLLSCRTEVLGLKFILEDNSFFFLDAGSHTIWSTGRIPKYFSSGMPKTKVYLQRSILENTQPLILQAPPGFDAPTPAFLNFIASFQLEKPDKAIKRIELYSLDNQLIDIIQSVPQRKRYFIFGLWPWQYKNRDRENVQQLSLPSPSLRSFVMTNNDNRKILDIITNLETEIHSRSGEVSSTADTSGVKKAPGNQKEEKHSDNALIGHYLERWPNLELGYQDFLDKIGHFSLLSKPEITPKNNVHFPENRDLTLNELFTFWRWELNNYCQKHFLPLTYQGLDFLLLKERFYHLGGKVISEANYLKVIFEPPQDFPHPKDLQYACQRVNEADIYLLDGRKLKFEALTRRNSSEAVKKSPIMPFSHFFSEET